MSEQSTANAPHTNDGTPSQPAVSLARRLRVLLAEDQPEMRSMMAQVLRSDGYEVIEVSDGAELTRELLESAQGTSLDLLISDIRMPWTTGLDVLERLRRNDWRTPVILITAFGDADTHDRARELAALLLDKPFDLDDLRFAARTLLKND